MEQVLATVVSQSVQGPGSLYPVVFQSLVLTHLPTHSSTHLTIYPPTPCTHSSTYLTINPPMTLYPFTCLSDCPAISPSSAILSHNQPSPSTAILLHNHPLTLLSTHLFTHSCISPSVQPPVLPSLYPLSTCGHSWSVQVRAGFPQVHHFHSCPGQVRLALHCMLIPVFLLSQLHRWLGMLRSSLHQGLPNQRWGSGWGL